MLNRILIVDDDEVTRKLLKEVLEQENYLVQVAESGEEAVQLIRAKHFPVVLSDIRMLELDGFAILREAKNSPVGSSIVILMTGFGSIEGAIEAIQEGAFDYVSKPFKIDDLKALIARAFKHYESLSSTREPSGLPSMVKPTKHLIGKSPKIVEVYKVVARAAMSISTVLIIGESGTGKELVARAIHNNSPRKSKKFTAVNCGALSENLLESELFGHVKGAFTGAVSDKIGLFEEASGGTLFLDEIGDISPTLQVKLLRVLQESEVRPVGSSVSKHVSVRLIAATHQQLENLVQLGKFREDLYYRLKVISIELPALRERMEDLPDLVDHFLALHASRNKKCVSHVSEAAFELLKNYSWPGNIRELEHAIERAVAMTNTSVLYPEDFSIDLQKHSVIPNASVGTILEGKSLEQLEKSHILKTLHDVNFNKSRASEVLGIDRATLYRKAQKYGIDLRGKA